MGNATSQIEDISFSATPPEGRWQLADSPKGQRLSFGVSSFPIEQTPSGVRVVVDNDQDLYCDFTEPK